MRSPSKPVALLAAALLLIVAAGLWLRDRTDGGRDVPSAPADPGDAADTGPTGDREPAPGADTGYAGHDPVAAEGLVRAADDGGPIPGARVRVETAVGEWETVADGDGHWSLDLPPQEYVREPDGSRTLVNHHFFATAAGFLADDSYVDIRAGMTAARAPTIFLRRTRLSLRGRVVDEDGHPVAGATCEARFQGGGETVEKTDESGCFGPGPAIWSTLWLTVEAPGYLPSWTTHRIEPGRRRDVVAEVRLLRPHYATGAVVDEAGQPVPGAILRTTEPDFTLTTDPSGRFRWPLAEWGEVEFVVEKDGYYDHDPLFGHRVVAGEETRIVVRRAIRVEGTVLDHDGRPAAGLELWLRSVDGHHTGRTETDESGRFTLTTVPPGPLRIEISSGSLSLGEFRLEAREAGPLTGVVFHLPEPEIATVVVTDAVSGKPIEGAVIYARFRGAGEPLSVSDSRGYVPVPHRAGGRGSFLIFADRYVDDRVWLTGKEEGPIPVTLEPLGTVRLRTVDAEGLPVAGAEVVPLGSGRSFHGDREGVAIGKVGTASSQDLLIIHAAFDRRQVRVSAVPGETVDLGDVVLDAGGPEEVIVVRDAEGNPLSDAVLSTKDGKFRLADSEGRIRVPAGAEEPMVHAPGHVSQKLGSAAAGGETALAPSAPFLGRVVGPDGKPVAGAEVSATGLDSALTDASGRFEIPGAPEGSAGILTLGAGPFHEPVLQTWAVAGKEILLRDPGTAALVLDERAGEWLFRADVILPERENLEDGGPLKVEPRPLFVGSECRLPVPAGDVVLAFRTEKDGPLVVYRRRLEPGEVRKITLPEGDLPRIAVLPPPSLATSGIDYDVTLVGTDLALGDYHAGNGYRNATPIRVVGPPFRLRVSDLQYAVLYTAPLDLGKDVSITAILTDPGDVGGFLLSGKGEPVTGARVRLRAPHGFHHWDWDETSDEGEFYLGCDLPVGPQTVEIRLPERRPIFRKIEITAGRPTDVEIRLD